MKQTKNEKELGLLQMRVDKEKKIQDLIEEHKRKETQQQKEHQQRAAELKDSTDVQVKTLQESNTQKDAQLKELKAALHEAKFSAE